MIPDRVLASQALDVRIQQVCVVVPGDGKSPFTESGKCVPLPELSVAEIHSDPLQEAEGPSPARRGGISGLFRTCD